MKRVAGKEVGDVGEGVGRKSFLIRYTVFVALCVAVVLFGKSLAMPSDDVFQQEAYLSQRVFVNVILLVFMMVVMLLIILFLLYNRSLYKGLVYMASILVMGSFFVFDVGLPTIDSSKRIEAHNEDVSIAKLETKYDSVRAVTDEESEAIEGSNEFDSNMLGSRYYGKDEDGVAYLFQTYTNRADNKLKVYQKAKFETVMKSVEDKEEF